MKIKKKKKKYVGRKKKKKKKNIVRAIWYLYLTILILK